ncbi:MAG: response regulator [Candidatus Adiutrix sp.]|jgi:two-component system chemotaxis response regulator CheY|nr:response regulator [Candidatus Adiutrix sp.]
MAQANTPWRGKSVLVVDDYMAVRKTIKELVLSLGMVPTEAENGLKAQEILKSQPVDLVITDLVMPEMDGFELTEAIKNSPEQRKIPVVIISTHADSKYIFRALRLGADDYLTKPPTAEMVNTVLTRIFDHEW